MKDDEFISIMREKNAEHDAVNLKKLEDLINLSDGEIRCIHWQYRMLGGFFEALWGAIAHADHENLARLAQGFPEDVQAFLGFSQVNGYWEDLKLRAKSAGIIPEDFD